MIDADVLARRAVAAGGSVMRKIKTSFGPSLVDQNGELNRRAMADLIFSDHAKKKLLEDLVHPRVRSLFRGELKRAAALAPQPRLIVYVVPLLFESRYKYKEIKQVALVTAPREVCISRVMARDDCSRNSAERKYESQLDPLEKEKWADYTICNDGKISALARRVQEIYEIMTHSDTKPE